VFYPLLLDLKNRAVLVVGGGLVAERKVESLVEAGASVTVVAPEVTPALSGLSGSKSIRILKRKFEENDLEGALLVITATDDPRVQEQVAEEARKRNILVNTVDQPRLCDFIVPAVVRRGDILLTISTSGKSPALAAALRGKAEKVITEDAARAARLLGEIRSEVHARFADAGRRKKIFEQIVDSGILDWISEYDDATALKRVRDFIEKQP
jgi:precorrin-2 dehydrogenase/sirohydrochlorin ferrochelatase